MIAGGLYGLHAPLPIVTDHVWRMAGLMVVPGLALGAVSAVAGAAWSSAVREVFDGVLRRHTRGLAAAAFVVPPAVTLWLALVCRTAQRMFHSFHHAGLAALVQGVAYLTEALAVATPAVTLSLYLAARIPTARGASLSWLRRLAAGGAALAASMVAYGALLGDENGHGALLGVFGVMRRPEVDLVPAGVFAIAALLAPALWFALRGIGLRASAMVLGLAAGLFVADAAWFGRSPAGGRIDARTGPLQSVLAALRARSDRDHDGHSRWFGGADCDDTDPRRNPDAQDVPANGLDEDCSGHDAPRPPPRLSPLATELRASLHLPAEMNLLLLTVDTLRADMLGAPGGRVVAPRMTQLAREGAVFEQAYALASGTYHAVGPMLIGRYAAECARDDAHFTRYLPENVTLTERLGAVGFRTFGAAPHYYFEPRYGLPQGMGAWDTSANPTGEDAARASADDRVADTLITQLRDGASARGRFMAWGHFYDPHHAYADHPEIPLHGDDDRARYEREVTFTDRQIGRVLDALALSPFASRTVVVLTADHGEAFGEHGTRWHGVELWQELVRIPLVIRVPGLAPRRVTVARSVIDLAPTLLDVLDIPTADAETLSGRSLLGDLVGRSDPPRAIYSELLPGPHNRLRRAYVSHGWKLLERGAGRFELYHLAVDPDERTDLAASHPDDLARMLAVREAVRGGLRLVPAIRATREDH